MRKLHQEELQAQEDHVGMHYASQASLKGCLGEQQLYVINQRAGINGHMTRSNDGAIRGRGWAARAVLAAPVGQSKHKSTLGPRDFGGSAASLPVRQMQEQAMHKSRINKTVNHDDHPYANSTTTALPQAVAVGRDEIFTDIWIDKRAGSQGSLNVSDYATAAQAPASSAPKDAAAITTTRSEIQAALLKSAKALCVEENPQMAHLMTISKKCLHMTS